ncbi:MAG: CoA-transferase subunit beta [Negativicutes bacterium]
MAEMKYAKPGEYKPSAMMVIAAAREIKDGEVIFGGTGLPMVAIMAAQHMHAPNSYLVYEAGTTDGQPISLPSSVGGPRTAYKASLVSGVYEVMGLLQRGWIDIGFLGGAEVDKYGNVNCTCMGDYRRPTVRFPGPGGNPDINSLSRRTIYIMLQQKRRFSEQVSYATSPGWRVKRWKDDGALEWVSRQECYGKNFRGGPEAVITDMAVFRFNKETGLMYLDTVHPGLTVEDIKQNVGFDLDISRYAGETPPPTYEELDLLFNKIDSEGIYLT